MRRARRARLARWSVNTPLAQWAIGLDAEDPAAEWARVYRMQLASHGAGAAAAIGLSSIDLALGDIKGRHAGQPVWQLLGGERRPIGAYAGGIALGFSPIDARVAAAEDDFARGYPALKLRLGDTPENDCARVRAVRAALGDAIVIMADANTAYTLDILRAVAPTLAAAHVYWLEEPFPPHDYRRYRAARALTDVPLAAGENHYTRFDFERARDDGAITLGQPDLSKTGGLSAALYIARMAAESGIRIHPHTGLTALTALNMAASLRFLAAIANGGYFEADVTRYPPLRDGLASGRFELAADETYLPPTGAGVGIDISADLLDQYPGIRGAGYV